MSASSSSSTWGIQVMGNLTVEKGGQLHSSVYMPQTDDHAPHKKMRPKFVTDLPPCESPPPLFTGRSKYLEQIHANLIRKGENETQLIKKMVVLTGLGGIGKSTTALKYAAEYLHLHQNVVRINAETETDMIQSFLSLAEHLRVCDWIVEKSQKDRLRPADVSALVTGVYRHFSRHVKKGLFIFDNAIQMKGIQQFMIRENLPCLPYILVTSRNTSWGVPGDQIPTISMTTMGRTEAILFLKKVFGIHSTISTGSAPHDDADPFSTLNESLKQLCDLLGGYPLVLNLASAKISSAMNLRCGPGWSITNSQNILVQEIEEYQKEFEERSSHWVQTQFPDHVDERYDKIMANVWLGTMSTVEGEGGPVGKMAAELLNLIAYLPNGRISLKLCHFVYYNRRLWSRNLEAYKLDESRDLQLALGLLEKYSMLSMVRLGRHSPADVTPSSSTRSRDHVQNFFFGPGCGSIRVHRLVQKWTIEMVKDRHDPSSTLVRLLKFYEDNLPVVSEFEWLDPLLLQVKAFDWPRPTYDPYIILIKRQRDRLLNKVDLVKNFYDHLIEKRNSGTIFGDELECVSEYVNLCQMTLIFLSHWRTEFNDILMGKRLDMVMDNSSLFSSKEDTEVKLCQISVEQFLDFTLDLAHKYKDNYVCQDVAVQILVSLVYSDNFEQYLQQESDKLTKLREWMRHYAVLADFTARFGRVNSFRSLF